MIKSLMNILLVKLSAKNAPPSPLELIEVISQPETNGLNFTLNLSIHTDAVAANYSNNRAHAATGFRPLLFISNCKESGKGEPSISLIAKRLKLIEIF